MTDKYDDFISKVEELGNEMFVINSITRSDVRIKDNFFSKNSNIYDSSEFWYEDVHVDKMQWLLNDYTLNTDFPIEEVSWLEDIVNEHLGDKINRHISDGELDEDFDIGELSLDALKEHPHLGRYYDDTIEWIYYELRSYKSFHEIADELSKPFGIEYPDEVFNEIEALAYWTIYFRPDIWDEETAWRVGLVPFRFDGDDYLALGGCGMDLSPRLDAYQALVDGTIPSSSRFKDDGSYAKYVVGEELYNEVMEAIKCKPVITIKTL